MAPIPVALRRRVIQRAGGYCEYCLVPDGLSFYAHEIDHIVAEKHGGLGGFDNLAYSCWRCNRYKGSDLTSIDPDTGVVVQLFHPRTQIWTEHFRLEEGLIVPISAEGRATAALLQFNQPTRVAERARMIDRGQYPPRHHRNA